MRVLLLPVEKELLAGVELEIDEKKAVRELVRELCAIFPVFKKTVCSPAGKLLPCMRVAVDGRLIKDLDTPVQPGSDAVIFPVVSGG